MCNNERVNELIYDYTVKSTKTLIIMYTKERELLKYSDFILDLAKIYVNAGDFEFATYLHNFARFAINCVQ